MATVAPSVFYTEPSRWFMEQLLNMVPGTQNGGIYAAKPGYHGTRNGNLPTNYSVIQPPDKLGPATKAAAYDWTFPEAQRGDYSRISVYSARLRAAGVANDPRTDGWREFYGQADEDSEVEGYDFYFNRPASSDSSHLWHIHLSELRQFLDDLNNKQAMLSILKGQSLEDWLNQGGGGVVAEPSPHEIVNALANGSNDAGFLPNASGASYAHAAGFNLRALTARLDKIDITLAEIKAAIAAIPDSGGGGLVPHVHSIGTTGTSEEE
jgi:hypothetical protein